LGVESPEDQRCFDCHFDTATFFLFLIKKRIGAQRDWRASTHSIKEVEPLSLFTEG
jgi:hypothetical protein